LFILLAVIAACALGIGVHYLLPLRHIRGVVIVPAVATAAAALIYTGLQWIGVEESNVWLWVASIAGGLVLSAVISYTLCVVRERRDDRERAALGI